ncbi:hypothetical protein NQ318_016920 [Aromia moschata]|uniref:Uncharacterized protein n=1 Tax=Aromia moschata TaxID=1265417 RepID=A0AAV8XIV0_9CUCU|nr:hypothetical protein NQ318_016920 [Aromia moschata]
MFFNIYWQYFVIGLIVYVATRTIYAICPGILNKKKTFKRKYSLMLRIKSISILIIFPISTLHMVYKTKPDDLADLRRRITLLQLGRLPRRC